MKRRDRVVTKLREARDIHQDWVDALRERDPWAIKRRTIVGDIKHHESWVRLYDAALRELGAS